MVAYLDQAGVQHLIAKIRNTFWPVGTILATTTNTSPASYIGGSWEAYAPGRTLVGVDKNHPLNSTGGSATHTITQQELPPHVHDLFARSDGDTNMDRGTSLRINGLIVDSIFRMDNGILDWLILFRETMLVRSNTQIIL